MLYISLFSPWLQLHWILLRIIHLCMEVSLRLYLKTSMTKAKQRSCVSKLEAIEIKSFAIEVSRDWKAKTGIGNKICFSGPQSNSPALKLFSKIFFHFYPDLQMKIIAFIFLPTYSQTSTFFYQDQNLSYLWFNISSPDIEKFYTNSITNKFTKI